MEGYAFDEDDLFRAVHASGARVLLIGRRALVALGLPVLTAAYDFWVHFDDVEALNRAMVALGYFPNYEPTEARQRGRYVFENGEHIDVMLARSKSTAAGELVTFDDVWSRHQVLDYLPDVLIHLPSIDDLIRTKEWAMRPKDVHDIQLLRALRKETP